MSLSRLANSGTTLARLEEERKLRNIRQITSWNPSQQTTLDLTKKLLQLDLTMMTLLKVNLLKLDALEFKLLKPKLKLPLLMLPKLARTLKLKLKLKPV